MARASVELIVEAAKAVNPLRAVNTVSKKAEQAINKLKKAVERTGPAFQKMRAKAVSALQKIKNKAKEAAASFKGFGKAAAIAAAAAGAAAFLKFSFGAAGELERQTKSLQVLTGSLNTAKKIISELQAFGAVTPFESQELIETAKRLKAFGFETKQLVDVTKRLSDVAGATGADLGGIATAFGQIQAKGRLQTEELLQLQERGVGLGEELQKMYKMSGTEFSKALEKGQISAEAANVALIRLTEQGGKYANGAVAQSDTLFGKLSTLQDAFQRFGQNIGKFLSPIFKGIIDFLTTITNQINNLFGQMARNSAIDKQARKNLGLEGGGRLTGQERAQLRGERNRLREAGFGLDQLNAPKTPDMTIPKLLQGRAGIGGSGAQSKEADRAQQIAEASAERVRSLEQQKLLASALTEEEQKQFERQIQIADIIQNTKGFSEEQLRAELAATIALHEQQDATEAINKANEQRKKDADELAKKQKEQADEAAKQAKKLEDLYKNVGTAIENGIVNGIMSAIDGTKSLQESLASVLRDVGSLFLQFGVRTGLNAISPSVFPMAEGGYVSGPTNALIGEGGEPEYVIPESKMRESMSRYSRGSRGSSVIPEVGGSGASSGGGGLAVAAPIDVRYTVERINSVDYVTADQFQNGMQQAATQGAKQGEQQTLKRLQMSSSARRRIGI